MYKLKITGYDLRPGSDRCLARGEMGQLLRQGLAHVNRGENWRLARNDDGDYVLVHGTKKEVKSYALEITC